MKSKICSRCYIEKPFKEFRRHAGHSDGYASECKKCAKKWYSEHRNKVLEWKRKYRANPENRRKEKEYDRLYNLKNSKKRVEYNKEYIRLHPEWAKEQNRIYYKRYREERLVYAKEFKKRHRAYYNEQDRKRRNLKNNLPATLTEEEWQEILEFYEHKCYYCNKSGTKENPLEKDHKIPLSRGGGYTKENIIPACRNCNAKKFTLTDKEFKLRLARLTK